jgi:hypothetical protein
MYASKGFRRACIWVVGSDVVRGLNLELLFWRHLIRHLSADAPSESLCRPLRCGIGSW